MMSAGEVLDGDVAHGDDLLRDLGAFGLRDVEEDAALALVVLVEVAGAVGAGLAVGPRRQHAQRADAPVDSMRMTSAPMCASCRVQVGPAQTQVKSATRMPSSGPGIRRPSPPLRDSIRRAKPERRRGPHRCAGREWARASGSPRASRSVRNGAPGCV